MHHGHANFFGGQAASNVLTDVVNFITIRKLWVGRTKLSATVTTLFANGIDLQGSVEGSEALVCYSYAPRTFSNVESGYYLRVVNDVYAIDDFPTIPSSGGSIGSATLATTPAFRVTP